jgi:dipeptidyl aminopeptidase/acylaminoacyl peptidase
VLRGSLRSSTTALRRKRWLALLAAISCVAGDAVAQGAFPGRPGRVAFSAQTGNFNNQNTLLWDYDPRTKTRRRLTARGRECGQGSGWADGGHAYSPDGRWIAYLHSDGCGPSSRNELRVMRADGSNNRRVAVLAQPTDPHLESAAFSPDGRRIALNQGVFDVATGTPIHSSLPGETGGRLEWAMTGRLAGVWFGAGLDDFGARIVTTWPHGTGIRFVTSVRRKGPSISYDESPDWSPTGRSIVFQRNWWNGDLLNTSRSAIWKVSPGRPATRIQRTPGDFRQSPTFSPSGGRIAFVGYEPTAILTVAANGNGSPRVLLRRTPPIQAFHGLDWQPLPARVHEAAPAARPKRWR